MENKPTLDKKYLCLHIAITFVCYLASLCMDPFAHARQAELAELFNISTNTVLLISDIVRISLLAAGFYLSLRIRRYLNAVSAVCKEEIEKQERRKRELAEEDARARAWVHSSEI